MNGRVRKSSKRQNSLCSFRKMFEISILLFLLFSTSSPFRRLRMFAVEISRPSHDKGGSCGGGGRGGCVVMLLLLAVISVRWRRFTRMSYTKIGSRGNRLKWKPFRFDNSLSRAPHILFVFRAGTGNYTLIYYFVRFTCCDGASMSSMIIMILWYNA